MSILPTRPSTAVESLTAELAAEVAAHRETRLDLITETARAETRGYALSLFGWWALPWLARDEDGESFVTFAPPEPDEPLPVDLSVAPLIFDQLAAETAARPAALSGPVRRRRRLRGRGRRLIAVALAAAALAAAGMAFRRSRP